MSRSSLSRRTPFITASLLVLIGFGFIALESAQADSTPPKGFVALFNGKDLDGWYGWGTRDPKELTAMSEAERAEYKKQSIDGELLNKKGENESLKAHWRVENGELVNDGKGLYLTTDRDYADFELMLEYKALPKGDSGVYLRGIPQIQIWDSTEGDPRGLGQDKGSGGLWNNSAGAAGKDPLKKMDKPFGEWNQLHVTMIGERVTVKLNGEVVVDDAVLENYFANKNKGYTAFGDGKKVKLDPKQMVNDFMRDPVGVKGPIQLQTHGSEIRWRNLFIREIGVDEANAKLAARNTDGFVELVNGKDLSNWKGAVENYEMKDGAVVCKKGKGGDLLSMDEYEDCLIRVEFKLPEAGNNGIAIRTPPNSHSAKDGLELQIIDSDGYNKRIAPKELKSYQYHGSLYHCVGAKHGFLRPAGQWNFQEVEIRGQTIKVTLNGTKILDVDIEQLDRSKLELVPKGLDQRRGHVGLAGHNDPVEFRSFKVKRL